MAEKKTEVKPIYIKLGDQAKSFYDAANGIQLIPGKVLKIDKNAVNPKGRTAIALRNGHIVIADQDEYDTYQNGDAKEVVEVIAEDSFSKAALVNKAKELGSELTKSALKKLSAEELKEIISELSVETDDEE